MFNDDICAFVEIFFQMSFVLVKITFLAFLAFLFFIIFIYCKYMKIVPEDEFHPYYCFYHKKRHNTKKLRKKCAEERRGQVKVSQKKGTSVSI